MADSSNRIRTGDKAFGRRLATKRRYLGWSGKTLAAKVGVSGATISGWESGLAFPSGPRLAQLAAVIGESVEYLLGSEPMPGEVENLVSKLSERLTPEVMARIESFSDQEFDQLGDLLNQIVNLQGD